MEHNNFSAKIIGSIAESDPGFEHPCACGYVGYNTIAVIGISNRGFIFRRGPYFRIKWLSANNSPNAVNEKNGRTKTSQSATALHKACIDGQYEKVETLLKQKTIDKNARDHDGRTPLSLAAECGHLAIVALLLKSSEVNVQMTDNNSLTALHYACKGGHFEVICELIEKGGKVEDLFVSREKDESSPLQSVLHSNSPQSQELAIKLLKYIAKREKLKELAEASQQLLSIAALNGKKEVVEYLLTLGGTSLFADEKASLVGKLLAEENADGCTPLHHAVLGPTRCAAEITEMLVNKIEQLKLTSLLNKQTTDGKYTALHLAAERNIEVVKKLEKLDPSITDKNGNTPLHLCVQKMTSVDAVRNFLNVFCSQFGKPQFSIDSVNEHHESALAISVKLLDKEKVAELIARGASLIIQDKNGEETTLLHLLVDVACMEPDAGLIDAVCNTVFANLVTWWCKKRNLNVPLECSKLHEEYRRTALMELQKCGRLNFLQYAAIQGAHELLAGLVGQYCTYGDMYDVTWFTFETMPEIEQTDVACYQCKDSIAKMPVLKHIISGRQSDTTILKMEPFNSIVKPYMAISRVLNFVALFCHFIFMVTFTSYALTDRRINDETSNDALPTANETFDDMLRNGTCAINQNFNVIAFGVWPLLNLIYDVGNSLQLLATTKYFQADFLFNFRSKRPKRHRYEKKLNVWVDHMLFDLIFSVGLFVMVAIWCWSHVTCRNPVTRLVTMSLAFLIGWSYMINYISNVNKNVAILVTILKKIILHDMLRFILFYFFILLSFSLSFHALTTAKLAPTALVGPIIETVFATFRQILSIEDVRESLKFGETMSEMNVMTFADLLYIAYSIASTIVLLNLLIAMMSGTYGDAVQRAGEVLVSCDMYAIDGIMTLERCCPRLMRRLLRQKFVDVHGNRVVSGMTPAPNRWFMEKEKSAKSVDDESDEDQYRILTEIAKCQSDLQGLREEERQNVSDVKAQLEIIKKEQKRLSENFVTLNAKLPNSNSEIATKTEPDVRQYQPLHERPPSRSRSPATVLLPRK